MDERSLRVFPTPQNMTVKILTLDTHRLLFRLVGPNQLSYNVNCLLYSCLTCLPVCILHPLISDVSSELTLNKNYPLYRQRSPQQSIVIGHICLMHSLLTCLLPLLHSHLTMNEVLCMIQ